MNFPSKVFLAPMAGITDLSFRSLCVKYGASVTVSEMISAKSLIQNQEKTKLLTQKAENEKNYAIQLFGSEAESMAQAAELIESSCSMIDINMGCPVPKVCKTGAGSALLENPELAGNIVKAIVNRINIPITVKIRTGIDDHSLGIPIAKICEDNGASLITVHGRTREQGYSGKANWNAIHAIKENVSIPVVGNGDINSPELAKEKLNTTDYVAIGRAASGNPLLFKEINDFLRTGKYKRSSPQQRLKVFEEYLKLAQKHRTAFLHQKLQAQHFTKGLIDAAKLRLKLNYASNPEELINTVKNSF